jgi:hypothetical protein
VSKGVVLAGVALLLIGLVVVVLQWQSAKGARDTYRLRADSLQAAVDSLEVEYARVKAEVPAPEPDGERNFWYEEARRAQANQGMLLQDVDLKRLKKAGLADPVNRLRNDLVAHPELIQTEGVMGGTMGFNAPEIALLNSRWVFARFEDGHIAGSCLLEYHVAPDSTIQWTVLKTMGNSE